MFYLQLGMSSDEIGLFLKHGFDTFESILYLDEETLVAMSSGNSNSDFANKRTREMVLRNVERIKETATTSTEPSELVARY